MNAEVKTLKSSAQAVKPNQILVVGRIKTVQRYENRLDHVVATPAPDPYSKPSLFRVNAPVKLGAPGDDIEVLCTFNGFPNDYKNKAGETVNDVRGFFVTVE